MVQMLLFSGSIVYTRLCIGCPDYGALILPVQTLQEESASFLVPYNDSYTWETETILVEHINGIELSFTDLFTLFGISEPKNIPPHIKYFHELQNWYQSIQNRPLVDLKKFDDRDGDVWIDISQKYRAFCGIDEKELYEYRNP